MSQETGYKIINIYKPPPSQLKSTTILTFPYPSLYVGDFNCQHVHWSYSTTSPDIESLDSWAAANNFALLHNPKGIPISSLTDVMSAPTQIWPLRVSSRTTNCQTDVFSQSSRGHNIDPSLIISPSLKVPAYSHLVKGWNFDKDEWKHFCLLTKESIQRLQNVVQQCYHVGRYSVICAYPTLSLYRCFRP